MFCVWFVITDGVDHWFGFGVGVDRARESDSFELASYRAAQMDAFGDLGGVDGGYFIVLWDGDCDGAYSETRNPQRSYPRAMLLATVIILVTLISGSLSIAVVLPQKEISLVAGIMQAFDSFFSAYHLKALLPFVAVMLVVGMIGTVNNWVLAPTRGLVRQWKHLPSDGVGSTS